MMGEEPDVRYLPGELYPMESHHKKEIEEHFAMRSDVGTRKLLATLEGVQVVFLCFTNRVGSNYLTDLLHQAGFGVRVAEEDLNSSSAIATSRRLQLRAFDEYLAHVAEVTKRNGTLLCKIGPAQLFWLTNRGFTPDFFPNAKYAFIRRRDKVAQAISWYIATGTGRYTTEIPGNGWTPVFDKIKIAGDLRYIMRGEQDFRYFFALHGIDPFEAWYEDFASQPRKCIWEFARFSGHSGQPWLDVEAVDSGASRIKSQRSEINELLCAEMRKAFALGGQ